MEFIPVVATIGALFWMMNRAKDEATHGAWGQVAKKLGLAYAPGSLMTGRRLAGVMSGMNLVVDTAHRGSGNSRSLSTRFELTLSSPLGLQLDLRPEGVLSTIGKLLGSQDILVGEPSFDDSVMVQGTPPEAVKAYLTKERRTAVAKFLKDYPSARISDAGVFMTEDELVRDAAKLEKLIRRMVTVGSALQYDGAAPAGTGGRAAPVPAAAGAGQGAGDAARSRRATAATDRAATRAPKAPVPPHEPPQKRERRPGGRPAPEPEAERAAAVPAPEPELAAEPVPAVEADRSPSSATGLTADAVCDALFDGHPSSIESTQRFESQFKNQRVRWTGTLRWVDAAAFDPAFGFDTVARAIVEVAPAKPGRAGGKPIQALVRVPTEVAKALVQHVAGQIEFEGRLTGLDAFARNLYVDEAIVHSPTTQ